MSIERLHDFLSTVIVYAPDRFPKRDFLTEADQMTLDRAFEELNHGMQFVRGRIQDKSVLSRLQQILDASLAAYRGGEDVVGAHLLQDFEDIVFGQQ
jgi:hypothetical protein